jgi:hypothetical protein
MVHLKVTIVPYRTSQAASEEEEEEYIPGRMYVQRRHEVE